jgi:small subunit ribosomal protein S9
MEKTIQTAAVGRRKEAVARVYLTPGTGKTLINGKDLVEYLGREVLVMQVREPLEVTETLGKYDILATVNGGGPAGQAGALKLGIARALVKAGRRKRFQFSKR